MRRVTGTRLGRFLADEVAGPLGLDLYLGLPEDYVMSQMAGNIAGDPRSQNLIRAVRASL